MKSHSGRPSAWRWIAIVALAGVVIGCARVPIESAPEVSGTFAGETREGRSTEWTFHQTENAIAGRGVLGAREYAVSGLVAWHGPAVFVSDEGDTTQGYITLSPDGEQAVISGLDVPIELRRRGEPATTSPGRFNGHYIAGSNAVVRLDLKQVGSLVSGLGFVNGKAVAVVGTIQETGTVSATVLFSDESRSPVTAELSDDGQSLSIYGLGGPVELTRR